ncbi:MAG: DUF892 family protein [Solirubrobacteraceae bacterium]
MTADTLDQQLTTYLSDVHAIEEQALVQMRDAPGMSGDPEIAAAFERHHGETREHERRVNERLTARDAKPSTPKDVAGRLTGKGLGLFAALQPKTPGKLVVHAYSYEHMELAAYELLALMADRAADHETAATARLIGAQEREMATTLESLFDRAVTASMHDAGDQDPRAALHEHLADAHAIERQAIGLLEKGSQIAGSDQLTAAYLEHLGQTHEHQRLVAERLDAGGASPSRLKDAAMAMGALNWGAFFSSQPDTPAKLAAFSYAVEHLEVAAYELLGRVARRAADAETEAVALGICEQERVAAQRIRALFPAALEASLHELGVGAMR